MATVTRQIIFGLVSRILLAAFTASWLAVAAPRADETEPSDSSADSSRPYEQTTDEYRTAGCPSSTGS